jgi:hypothetical protein
LIHHTFSEKDGQEKSDFSRDGRTFGQARTLKEDALDVAMRANSSLESRRSAVQAFCSEQERNIETHEGDAIFPFAKSIG